MLFKRKVKTYLVTATYDRTGLPLQNVVRATSPAEAIKIQMANLPAVKCSNYTAKEWK